MMSQGRREKHGYQAATIRLVCGPRHRGGAALDLRHTGSIANVFCSEVVERRRYGGSPSRAWTVGICEEFSNRIFYNSLMRFA